MCHRNAVVMQCSVLVLLTTLALALAGCSNGDSAPSDPNTTAPPGETSRSLGDTAFTSADDPHTSPPADEGDAGTRTPTDDQTPGGDEKTVEQGDIYRVLTNNLLLNLNTYRGLQVIDFGKTEQATPDARRWAAFQQYLSRCVYGHDHHGAPHGKLFPGFGMRQLMLTAIL